ncbi:EscJ/YscJ/HrcJ family type III secretion inner membrane ring protein [Trinickia fusca]|uniref:Lipoprotein n=1 Tax=Trinickia fusca TaxID=2419777 RepID=A0A494X8H5_9BURK|nr:EscJ/YscJ/HrcJ family type III secretion inner membrane ring protein [Trinickia fusca]
MERVARRYVLVGWMLIVVLSLAGCGKRVELRTGISETDANEIVAALADVGIRSEKEVTKDGYSVNVGEQDMSASVKVLESAGLPRDPHAQMGDIFKKDGMISSPLEERSRYLFALSQELERTLCQIDGVLVARVHIVLPERIAPGDPVQPSSAAVFIKYRPDVDIETHEFAIRSLVAASIPGLSANDPKQIAVVFVPALEAGSRPSDSAEARVSGASSARMNSSKATTAGNVVLLVAAALAGLLLIAAAGVWVFRERLRGYWKSATARRAQP